MDIEKWKASTPKALLPTVEMNYPNQNLEIYAGIFELKSDTRTLEIEGRIWYKWYPEHGVNFSGLVKDTSFLILTQRQEGLHLFINGLKVGACLITRNTTSERIEVSGILLGESIFGDPSIPVNEIEFSLLNLRPFYGNSTYTDDENGVVFSRSRLIFENIAFTIVIDEFLNSEERGKLVKAHGGYLIMYSGKLYSKKPLTCRDSQDILQSFSEFLGFLNGRRCSPIFRCGTSENKIIWKDYTSYASDTYKEVTSWPTLHNIQGINECWDNFHSLWKSDDNREFIKMVLHWYVEANSNSAYVEGSIIMAQTALELIYNWLLIENKRLLWGEDAKNISASNKIRLLVSHLGLTNFIPSTLDELHAFALKNKEDGPEAFVSIRNALVHSQQDKRRKLSQISNKAKYQALQLAIKYIELSLLNIFGFEGKFYDRASVAEWAGQGEDYVPWATRKSL